MQTETQAKLHVHEQGVAGISPRVLQILLRVFAMLGVASITGLSSFRSDNSRKFRNMYDCRYRDGSI
jgi:hypothetical protein